jgi:predicted Na+-dependent transporter
MRDLIETNFGLVLLISCISGLALPALAAVPDASASVALAILTYASCFKLKDGGFSEINWRNVSIFYMVRFIILPIILLVIAKAFFPEYAAAIFLLAILPTAVSSPAFANMFGGRVPPAFAIVILSTALAPFLITLQCSLVLSDASVTPTPLPLFRTLTFCVFVPMLLYFMTQNLTRLGKVMYDNVKIISIVLVAFVIALVIAKQREFILNNTAGIVIPILLTLICYIIFLACGWLFVRGKDRETRISYATCSMFNNVALGVSIALLHFPQNVILFVAVSEMAWAVLPMMFRFFLERTK